MLIWTFFLLAGCAGSSVSVDAGSDASVDADGADGADLDPGDQASAPVLDSVDPSVGPAAGGTPVTLSGSGFLGGASVRFGAVLATGVEVTSSSSIQVVTPPGSAGAVTLRVTNPDGRFGELAAGFTYLAPAAGDCPRASNCEPAAAQFSYSTGNPSDSVLLAGDFTGWRDGAIPMTGDGAGNFSASVTLREGRYEYKFIVNDNDWRTDPAAGDPEPFFGNSVLLHDNPCTPNLGLFGPAYGEVFDSDQVTISAGYQDGAAAAGIDPESICLVLDGERRQATWDDGNLRILAGLADLPEGDHRFWLSAADGEGHRSAELSGLFTINVAGELPVADAGPTQFAYPGDWVVLDATGSRDPDGIGISGYSWIQSAGPGVTLEPQHVTPHAGYDYDPLAEPPLTDALMGFSPGAAGSYRFSLTVSDADGTSLQAAETEVIVLNPGSGEKPVANFEVSQLGAGISVNAGASLPGSSFGWYTDVRNPGGPAMPSGALLNLSPDDLPSEGAYFFYLVASKNGSDGLPASLLVVKSNGKLSGYDFEAPPAWLPDAEIYEIYVRAFADGDGDGVGDLTGLAGKLDYLDDLGVNTLWLMPVFESADHAHGYHTMNYYRVERDYGTNDDLVDLIRAAHARGMRVVLDLVINHTSRHHPRFLAALDSASRFHGDYIWFINHQTSDPLVERYGFGRELGGTRLTIESGWADIPDVNFGSPAAREWTFGVARQWIDPNGDGDFEDGVDGLRLDHVTGPDHRVWRALRRELKSMRPDLLLLAEVFRDFDNAEQGYGIKDYYGDQFDLAFTFPFYWVAQGIFKNGEPAGGCATACGLDWLEQAVAERFDQKAVMCFFIENHDVPWYTTVYQDWGGSADKLMAANVLMQTLPNSPQILYGQELGTTAWRGMMPWVKDTPDNTLLSSYKGSIAARNDHPALRRGEYMRLAVQGGGGQDVFAFARSDENETLVMVVNVRGFTVGDVGIDLSVLSATASGLRDVRDDRQWPAAAGQLVPRSLAAYETWIGLLESP
jgi:glycosidase